MDDDLYSVPAHGVHSRDDVRYRAEARQTEIDELLASGASDEDAAAKIREAVAAHDADQAAYNASLQAGTAYIATPRLELVEALLGTPEGDEHAWRFGLTAGDLTVEQYTAMRRNGLSWAEIGKRATEARKAMRR